MPTIRAAGDRIVDPQALPGVRQTVNADPGAFGAGIGRAVAGLGQTVGQQGQEWAQAIDLEDTRKAREAFTNAQIDLDTEADNAKQVKGIDVRPKDKPALSADFQTKADKVYGKYTQGLSASAREKFNRVWQPLAKVRSGQVARYEQDEVDRVDLENSELTIRNAQKAVVADPNNPESVTEAKGRIGAEVSWIGKKKGQTPEQVFERYTMEVTKAHVGGIDALLAADRPQEAKAYYDKYREEVDARVRPDIEKKLLHENNVAASQTQADQLWAKHRGDLTAALAEARDSNQGDLEELVVRQLKVRADEKDGADRQRKEQVFNSHLDRVLKAETAADAMTAALKAEDPQQRLRLMTVASQLGKAETAAGNPAGYVEVAEMIDGGTITTPQQAQAAILERGGSKKQAQDAVNYLQQGGLAGDVKMTEITRLAKQWKPKVTAQELGDLSQYIIEDLKKQQPGKPVTPEDLAQRVASYMWNGETTARRRNGQVETPGLFTPGAGWNQTGLQARKAGDIEAWLPDVASDEVETLRAEIADQTGLKVDKIDETMVRVWKKRKAGLPMGEAQKVKVPAPRKAEKAPVAGPDAATFARQRSVSASAAAILDNSGGN